jgi:VWFA-related protein
MLLSAGLLTAFALVAQNPSTIRVDVPLVTVDVTVSDAAGRAVSNLTRDDFEILDDGKPQQIRFFAPVESPYSIQLLIDRSAGMQSVLPLFESALARFLMSLKPQDRVSIGAFDERSKNVELLMDWRETRNGTDLDVALNPVVRGGYSVRATGVGTSSSPGTTSSISVINYPQKDTTTAIEGVLKRLAAVETRKGAIIFGDGSTADSPTRTLNHLGSPQRQLVDGQDDGDFQKLLRAVRQSPARLNFVAVGTDLNPWSGGRYFGVAIGKVDPEIAGIARRARLEQLAAASGGRILFPRRAEDLSNLYEEIARELGTSYTLGYTAPAPSKSGEAHRIEVRAKNGMTVRQSRHEYR